MDRRRVLYGGAMAAAGVVGLAVAPRAVTRLLPRDTLARVIPASIGPWRLANAESLIIPLNDEQQKDTYDQVLTRAYRAPGLPDMMLLVAYGSGAHGLSQVHRPEACYPAFGFTMSNRRALTLPLTAGRAVPATFYTARSYGRVEQLVYWTRVGARFPTSWREETVDLALANLKGVAPDGVLVRVSTIGNDPAVAMAAMGRFQTALIGSLSSAGRIALLGEA